MIVDRQRRIPVALAPLEEFLERVRRAAGLAGHDVTVCLVSDAWMARMNCLFRGKRGPTDVLSFPADRSRSATGRRHSGAGKVGDPYLGDIAISPETARRNARRAGRSLPRELRVLILHGVLHLAGYDHETDNGQMARREGRLRRRLGLS